MQLKEGRENAIYKRLAVTDLLTGLYNRNAYESWEQSCQGTIEGIGLAVCDLNNLKYYNDTFGHETGDRCIKPAAGREPVTGLGEMNFWLSGTESRILFLLP